jgi:hypothetical protein
LAEHLSALMQLCIKRYTMLQTSELWRSSRTFQLVSRASYMDAFSGLSSACPGRANIGTGSLSSRRGCVGAVRITTPAVMDRASQALAGVISAGESAPYRAVSEKSSIPRSTLHRRKHGGASIEPIASNTLPQTKRRPWSSFCYEFPASGTLYELNRYLR